MGLGCVIEWELIFEMSWTKYVLKFSIVLVYKLCLGIYLLLPIFCNKVEGKILNSLKLLY